MYECRLHTPKAEPVAQVTYKALRLGSAVSFTATHDVSVPSTATHDVSVPRTARHGVSVPCTYSNAWCVSVAGPVRLGRTMHGVTVAVSRDQHSGWVEARYGARVRRGNAWCCAMGSPEQRPALCQCQAEQCLVLQLGCQCRGWVTRNSAGVVVG